MFLVPHCQQVFSVSKHFGRSLQSLHFIWKRPFWKIVLFLILLTLGQAYLDYIFWRETKLSAQIKKFFKVEAFNFLTHYFKTCLKEWKSAATEIQWLNNNFRTCKLCRLQQSHQQSHVNINIGFDINFYIKFFFVCVLVNATF